MIEESLVQIAEKSESPFCQIRLVLTIDPYLSNQEHQKALKEIGGEVTLAGYRKGKIPSWYLQKHYHNQINSRWSQKLAESALAMALEKISPPPFVQNQRVEFTWDRLELDAISTLNAHYESEPLVPEQINWRALTVEPPRRLDDLPQAVESALWAESEKRATFCDVSGPSQMGSFIDFEIRSQDASEQILLARKKCPLQREQLPEWAFDLLLNLETGKERLGNASVVQGEPSVECRARIDRITTRNQPPIDDTLAKELGFERVELWRDALGKRLAQQSEEQFRSDAHQLLLEAAVNAHPFEVPKSGLEREIASLKEKGKIKRFKNEDELRQHALVSLRQFFLLSHWSKTREDLVSKEQIDRIVFGQLRHLDPKISKEVLQRQLAFLYHNARLSQIASAVLDESMQQLGWTIQALETQS